MQEDVIDYCATWYIWIWSWEHGTHVYRPMAYSIWFGLFQWGWKWWYSRWKRGHDIGETPTMNESKLPMDDVGGSNEPKSSNVPMEITLACLCDMIQDIIQKCKQGVMLCDHINSFMRAKHMKKFPQKCECIITLGNGVSSCERSFGQLYSMDEILAWKNGHANKWFALKDLTNKYPFFTQYIIIHYFLYCGPKVTNIIVYLPNPISIPCFQIFHQPHKTSYE